MEPRRSASVAVNRSTCVVDAVGDRPALFDDGFLEHQQAAGEGFVDPVGMSRDGIDCFIRGFREALVEIIGLIADRRDRLLRGRVEILG